MSRRPFLDQLLVWPAKLHAQRVLRRFYRAAQNATRVQDEVLIDKIHRNADSDYGRRHGFHQIRNYEDFIRQVPVQTYDDFEPYIQRLCRGEHSALFGGGQRVRMFALTSGTSATPKYIPVTDTFLKELRAGWNAFGVKALLDHPGWFLKPIVQVASRMDEQTTEGGIPCGAVSGLMAATQKPLVRRYYLTPPCVAYIEDSAARYYTIMRLAMMEQEIAFLVTANPSTQLKLARTAEESAESLIRDIHDGTLQHDLDVPPAVRKELAHRLRPDSVRARQLQSILDREGHLRPRHYWRLGFICNWMGGTLGLYLRDFPRYFGDVPVRDIGLIASEGRMSIPVSDGTPAGILEVTSHFYEFIPVDQIDHPHPDCLRCREVEIGKEYFIVLTNSAGLYRYSIGDLVRVTGFEGQAPIIEFLSKGAHTCSLTGEKLTEKQVTDVVNSVAREQSFPISSYLCAPQWGDPPGYMLHLDLSHTPEKFRLDQMITAVEQRLGEINIEYASKRKTLRLAPLRYNVLPHGFLEQRDQIFWRNADALIGNADDDIGWAHLTSNDHQAAVG